VVEDVNSVNSGGSSCSPAASVGLAIVDVVVDGWVEVDVVDEEGVSGTARDSDPVQPVTSRHARASGNRSRFIRY